MASLASRIQRLYCLTRPVRLPDRWRYRFPGHPGEEIAEQTGRAAFSDRGRIQSFLFLAAEPAEDSYSLTHLAETTRAVNRLFPLPALLFYRHGEMLTLAGVHSLPTPLSPLR